MKIKVYEVFSSSYELSDSFLHQESQVFTDKEKAMELFNGWVACAKEDIRGDEYSEFEYTEDCEENYFNGSREIGTEDEYQIIVELKEYEFEV